LGRQDRWSNALLIDVIIKVTDRCLLTATVACMQPRHQPGMDPQFELQMNFTLNAI
jgi:hypothetical protein